MKHLILVLFLTGCSTIRTHEEIVVGVLEDYQSDSITHHVNYWVPNSSADDVDLSDEVVQSSTRDQEQCIDNNRGAKFKDEAFSIVLFLQCMNEKKWRLYTKELIIISH